MQVPWPPWVLYSYSWQPLQVPKGSPGKLGACSLRVLSRRPTLPFLHQISSVLQGLCLCYLPQAAFPASLYSPLPPKISGTSRLQLWGRAFLSNQLSLNCLAQLSNLELEDAIHTSVSFPKFKYVMIEIFFLITQVLYIQCKTLGNYRKTQNKVMLPILVFILVSRVYFYACLCVYRCICICVCSCVLWSLYCMYSFKPTFKIFFYGIILMTV